ncbi:hypothetical protein ECANGB1_488 [Enterospora canceri]|uniref:Glutaredoxin domain-containing protein n=1 Tax=Enterospora canceri TaxID=1081671 RepID=A0A1Y1S4D7_9MICR|nr:hypothetical protein ECANGB1_488 [Enterospora canceri]
MLFKYLIGVCGLSVPARDRSNEVIIITRDGCGYSEAMREMCKDRKLKCLDLNEDTLKADIKAITSKKFYTYPMVFEDGEFIGGYNEAEKHFRKRTETLSEEVNQLFKANFTGYDS